MTAAISLCLGAGIRPYPNRARLAFGRYGIQKPLKFRQGHELRMPRHDGLYRLGPRSLARVR
jgi:hypothetical protein